MLDGIPRNHIPLGLSEVLSPFSFNPLDHWFDNIQLIKVLKDFYTDSLTLNDPHPNTSKIADIYPKLSRTDRFRLQNLFEIWMTPRTTVDFKCKDHLRMVAVACIYHIAPYLNGADTSTFHELLLYINDSDFTTIIALKNATIPRMKLSASL
jgi:hypothetical protein